MTNNPGEATEKLESFLTRLDDLPTNIQDVTDDEMSTTDDAANQELRIRTLPEKDGVDLQAAKRTIRHLIRTNLENADPDLDPLYAQGSSAIFAYLCTLLHLDYDAEIDGRATKRTIFDYLIHSVS
jgi:hypothetical protein